MAEHPNTQIVRDLFTAFRQGDVSRVEEILTPDSVWHFPGRNGQLAGAHRGRDAIVAFLMKVMVLTEGSFHLELEAVLANDSTAVALFRGRGRRNDKVLDNPTCLRI
jgi:ketosteroid isomerase-like protein